MSDRNLNFKTRLEDKNNNSELLVSLNIVRFQDGDTEILYAPALEVYGYGNNFEEAKQSFEVSFHEFVNYTHNKKTFTSELERLGWHIKGSKKNRKYTTPVLSELVSSNSRLAEIFNTKNVSTYQQEYAIA